MAKYLISKASALIAKYRMNIVGYPLELQLIYLFEILVIYLTSNLHDTDVRVTRTGDTLWVDTRQLSNIASSIKGLSPTVIHLIVHFRHTYVHEGHIDALPILKKLLSHRSELDAIAAYCDVTLNYNHSLYHALERISLNND